MKISALRAIAALLVAMTPIAATVATADALPTKAAVCPSFTKAGVTSH